jgi:hypothetical protein
MSFEKQLVYPTKEEIDLIRKKLNSIVDIPYLKQNNMMNNNNLLFNKTDINYTLPKSLNSNSKEIIEQLNQKIYELQNTLNSNAYKINNYDNLLNENKELNFLVNKLKKSNSNNRLNNNSIYDINDDENNYNNNKNKYNNSNKSFNNNYSYTNFNKEAEPEVINNLLNKNKYLNSEIDKLKRELYLSSKQNTSNKEILANYIQQVLKEHKGELNTELIKFLLDRIDKLEYQNFFLASKLENYIIIMNQYIEELCEYIDIIFDLTNVINDIPDNVINQNLNEDFFIVKDTLNNKKNMLNKKYEEYNNFKNILNTDDTLKNNDVFIMLGNKINDINNLIYNDKMPKEYSKILDEKIKKYENMKNHNSGENNMEMELMLTNNILEKKNSQLRQIIKDILSNDKNSYPIITPEIKEKLVTILNDDNSGQGNSKITNYCLYEDLIMMLNAQCYLNEMQINQFNQNQ